RTDLARRRELEQRRVVAARRGEIAERAFDRRCARAGSEPEREVVDALVAGETMPVDAVDDDSAVLARVVAPDRADEHVAAAAVGKRQRQRRSGPGTIERDDRFADVGGGGAGRRRDDCTRDRQAPLAVADGA